ncbi:hypothetical protein Ddc_16883 [Ditylenchus destructor]|nr:hypothetical protein Ddc_16883 [Ditylenchus destructor]
MTGCGMECLIRKPRITLPADIQGEILRHFSRKDLSQQLYLVNRQYYSVATSNSHVPVIHFIEKISFGLWASNFGNQVGIPGPFVRFRHVSLKLGGQGMLKCQRPAILKFLLATKESFVGCKLNISVIESSKICGPIANYIHSRVCNLLQNVFQSPLTLTICDGIWLNPEAIIETTASSNCRRLEFYFKSARCTEITNIALLNWLKIGIVQESDGFREKNVQKKHLVLESYPGKLSLRLIKQIKEDFEYLPSQNAEFVITFIQCRGSPLQILEKFDEFSLDNISTAERLSFFKYNPFFKYKTHARAYRLWCRTVTSEAVDYAWLTFLQSDEEIEGDIEFDQNIFSFEI